jgi:hypothetical protein
MAPQDTERTVSYASLYPRKWASPIFNHPRSFWDESYGVQIDSHPAGKIVVFGIPKAGNIWLKSLLVDYFGLPPVEPMYDIAKPGIGLTHRPFDEDIGNRADFLHGACIIRDLRDVVASYFYYSKTDRFRNARPEFHYDDVESFYYDWFLSRVVPAHKLMIHSEQYARLGVPIIRYEKLRIATTQEIERLVLRWGLNLDRSRLEKAVAENDISKLRSEGKHLEKVIAPEHFRRGGIGTYREELPNSIINDIEIRFARILRRWGYL